MKQQNRGKNIAIAGAVLQLAFTLVLLLVRSRTGAAAAQTAIYYFAGGVAVWLMTALLFYSHVLELREREEIEALSAGGESGGIFEAGRDLSMRPAAMRVAFIEKWVVPIFTLLLGAYYATMGVLVFLGPLTQSKYAVGNPLIHIAEGTLFMVVPGFLGFLFSRYCTGMSSQPQWRPLRAAASQLLLGTIFIAGIVGVFTAEWWGKYPVDRFVALVIPAVQILLAAEMLLTLLLDMFRPRVQGEERRLTYDSRILSLLADPTRVGHSIAETLNYQFGFEVSKTWFYKLLGKALVPLVILGVVVMWAISSLVIVRQGQRGVVLHWGRAQEGKLLEPGLNVKWPWPIDTVQLFDTHVVRDLQVGVGEARKPYVINGKELQLWTKQHGAYEELPFLLAIPGDKQASQGEQSPTVTNVSAEPANQAQRESASEEPPPVHIINLVLDIQYRVADPYKFGYRFTDAAKVLRDAAYREMVRYCASATLDTVVPGADPNRPQAIMTTGWGEASNKLQQLITKAVGPGELDLGVAIETVKLIAVHPPAAAAPDFEAVLAAERDQDRQRYQAEGLANETLASAAGDPDRALELALAIRRVERLESLSSLQTKPEQFDKFVRDYVRQSVEDLKTLRKEIFRDSLTGDIGRRTSRASGVAELGKALRDKAASLEPGVRKLVGQIADWPMLDEIGPSASARQRLAARQARNLIELLDIVQAGVKFDFAPVLADAHKQADTMFADAAGDAARRVAEAQAYKVQIEMAERTRAERFQRELDAWKACPQLYVLDRKYDILDEVLPGMQKYVICVDPKRLEVWMNWERQTGGLEGAFTGSGGNK